MTTVKSPNLTDYNIQTRVSDYDSFDVIPFSLSNSLAINHWEMFSFNKRYSRFRNKRFIKTRILYPQGHHSVCSWLIIIVAMKRTEFVSMRVMINCISQSEYIINKVKCNINRLMYAVFFVLLGRLGRLFIQNYFWA